MVKTFIPLLIALFALCANSHAQTPLLDLETLASGRHDMSFVIPGATTADDSPMPLTIIKGRQQGPVFTIVAGIHGYEYVPIMAVQKLMTELDNRIDRGTVVILPSADVAAFYGRSLFVNPKDKKNLNRVFPGHAAGTPTQRIAHWMTEQVIAQSDVMLDIHAGDGSEDLVPFVCYYNNLQNPDRTRHAHRLSVASGMDYIVSYPYNLAPTDSAQYAFKKAVQMDKVALSIESGRLGQVEPQRVDEVAESVKAMLRAMGMMQGKNEAKNQKIFTNQEYIKVPCRGIFYSDVKAGDMVTEGQELGYITDLFGRRLTAVKATKSGMVLYRIGTPPVNEGETLFCIALE